MAEIPEGMLGTLDQSWTATTIIATVVEWQTLAVPFGLKVSLFVIALARRKATL